ncbi:hypothetical protein BX616_009918 [Lobosporangium transversale]|uniref:Prolyl endopeptidase-like n=1 Tax=Lobosporangium transversale TaxID=64571 RepID=A0A1Y2GBR4_9FUNG|nr:hypothetical protein BCR41DRAFT_425155 [Lobosporangium transversale]KAF9918200.1 hypothetical protein BX616_009918 [Lobosporangium transversale]ORZ06322.1 hypothetical protein BCR41DRAFT_425155 [Lobosporangium transversale]|eukprot:XP_021877485.1 hypothetical protein BCR41DRAFT_425155 [Lobosporangium transversale]
MSCRRETDEAASHLFYDYIDDHKELLAIKMNDSKKSSQFIEKDKPSFHTSRPHNRLRSITKGFHYLERLFNLLIFSLTVLFLIAALNLLFFSNWPSTEQNVTPVISTEQKTKWSPHNAALNCTVSPDSVDPCCGSISNSDSGFNGKNDNTSHDFGTNNQSTPNNGRPKNVKPQKGPLKPPQAKRIPRPFTLHNETFVDNYRWMHQIKRDPDVKTYIDAESEYTAAWVERSGVQELQMQLENEMKQIKQAIRRQGKQRRGKLPQGERLEGTQFWDVDQWRYCLDDSIGDFGIYKRRRIHKDEHIQAMDKKRISYTSSSAFNCLKSQNQQPQHPQQSQRVISKPSFVDMANKAGTNSPIGELSGIEPEVVLDVNQIAKEKGHQGGNGQFSFGTLEIQPQNTLLKCDSDYSATEKGSPTSKSNVKALYMAYTYDTSGDERYRISVIHLPFNNQKSESCAARSSAQRRDEMSDGFEIQLNGAVFKDAGPDTRFVKLGKSLYLYFTKLDRKGLQREVWRLQIDTMNDDIKAPRKADSKARLHMSSSSTRGAKQLYEPEIVMQEKEERNILSVSMTNDQRFLLIESSGQTNSHSYFLSIDDPDRGWSIIRPPEKDVIYKVEHHSGFFYIRSNHGDAINFKVLRIPVSEYIENNTSCFRKRPVRVRSSASFIETANDQVVIEHDSANFLERFEVFVEHFVAWVWRDGLPEIRIFLAPRPDDINITLPLHEKVRIRPYHKELNVTTLMPGNIRYEEQRLFRDFFSAKLVYSNCSFIRPWALYEYDMHSISNDSLDSGIFQGDEDERQRNATRLIRQDPFPLDVKYGQALANVSELCTHEQSSPDSKEREEAEMAKFKEVRFMVPSKHRLRRNKALNDTHQNSDEETLIPVSVVYYTFPDGKQFPRRAALVNAYGAYGTLTSPIFDPEALLPLLHRGLIYVQVHPRGDGVLGPKWYRDGKFEKKVNTFLDVEDALLYLSDLEMVKKEGCAIQGRSAGGLVAGWIANRWGDMSYPSINGKDKGDVRSESRNIVKEMVRVVVTQVPFVDVISGMSDAEIPWVEYERDEWGNPVASQEIFEAMKGYSPYDRIRSQRYPDMMVMGGLNDARVSFAEPLKFVAKLRSIDGKTNDCQPMESDEDQEAKSKHEKNYKVKMCVGKKDTSLLLQMEDGGHFSGKESLWMAFALYTLDAEKVVSTPSIIQWSSKVIQ